MDNKTKTTKKFYNLLTGEITVEAVSPTVEGCVICDNEGSHNTKARPHVFAGQE